MDSYLYNARLIAQQQAMMPSRSLAREAALVRHSMRQERVSSACSYMSARAEYELAQAARHSHLLTSNSRYVQHEMETYVRRIRGFYYGDGVRRWMRPDLLTYTQLIQTLTDEEVEAIVLKFLKLWEISAKKSAQRFWGKLLLVLKKQEKIKQTVKSIFIPVKFLLDSLRPIEIAA